MNDEKKGMSKKPIAICGIALVFAVVISFVVLFAAKDELVANAESGTDQVVNVTEAPAVRESFQPTDASIQNTSTPTTQPEIEIVVKYTSNETDDESLIQLVKDTIKSANKQLEDARKNGERGRTATFLDAIEDADKRDDLNSQFTPLDGKANPLDGNHSEWTFLQVAGSVGYLLFNEKDLEKGGLNTNDMLKYFVAKGVYAFDTDKITDFDIKTDIDLKFKDEVKGEYDINFVISMTYDGVKWNALVGNINSSYRIFDIVNALDQLENVMDEEVVDKKEVEEPQTQTQEPPVDAEKYPTNDTPNDQGNYNNNGNVNEDEFYKYPDYEGPKEGYKYSPLYGYVKHDPTFKGGNMNPDQGGDLTVV